MSKANFYTDPPSNSTNLVDFKDGVAAGFAASRLRHGTNVSSGPVNVPDAGTTDIYLADTTSAGFTINLPTTPIDGEHYEFVNIGTNTLTIGRNGKTINGAAADASIVSQWAGLRLTWNATADTWWSR